MVAPHADILTRMPLGPALARNDISSNNGLAARFLDSKAPASGITTVAGTATCLLMCHYDVSSSFDMSVDLSLVLSAALFLVGFFLVADFFAVAALAFGLAALLALAVGLVLAIFLAAVFLTAAFFLVGFFSVAGLGGVKVSPRARISSMRSTV